MQPVKYATTLVAFVFAAPLAAVSQSSTAQCFDSGENFACGYQIEADDSFSVAAPGRGQVIFLVDASGQFAERLNYDPGQDRSFIAGTYRKMSEEGCWQNVAFEDDIFCLWR